PAQPPRRVTISARDLGPLRREIDRARRRSGLSEGAPGVRGQDGDRETRYASGPASPRTESRAGHPESRTDHRPRVRPFGLSKEIKPALDVRRFREAGPGARPGDAREQQVT